MAATFTATGYNVTPRLLHAGVVAQTFNFSYAGRSASVSDVIYIGRVQHGARCVGGWVKGKPGVDGNSTWKVGILGNDVFFGPALSISTSICTRLEAISGYPKSISLSADHEGLPYVPVIVTKTTGTSTVTGSIQVTLLLQAPDV